MTWYYSGDVAWKRVWIDNGYQDVNCVQIPMDVARLRLVLTKLHITTDPGHDLLTKKFTYDPIWTAVGAFFL